MMYLFDALCRFLRSLFGFFVKHKELKMNTNKLKIYVKCGPETMLPVDIDTNWTISNLKQAISSNLCMKEEELRIIFAGKELHDSIKLEVNYIINMSSVYELATELIINPFSL